MSECLFVYIRSNTILKMGVLLYYFILIYKDNNKFIQQEVYYVAYEIPNAILIIAKYLEDLWPFLPYPPCLKHSFWRYQSQACCRTNRRVSFISLIVVDMDNLFKTQTCIYHNLER